MGASHARLFIEEGAKVVIGDIRDDLGEELVEELGPDARYLHLDVTSYADWETSVQTVTDVFGGLDILVNNAGLGDFLPLEEYPFESWDRMIQLNLTGTFYGIRSVISPLKKSGRGSIINISSTAGLQGAADLSAYTAAKFGVRGLTKAAALELGHYNIRVNSVHPGDIRTPLAEGHDVSYDRVALHRMGEPIEISHLVLFLASDESSYCSGAEFVADGGETAGRASPLR